MAATATDKTYKSDIKAPTGELGQPANIGSGLGIGGWSAWIGDDLETVPELQWPNNVRIYSQMRNDAQMQGLWMGSTLPIRRFRWLIDPNESRPEVVDALSADLGLDILGQDPRPIGRQQGRFNFNEHLRLALHAIIYGHYPFEQVGEIGPDGLWHLKKLAERPPITLSEINVDQSGDLAGIRQNVGAHAGGLPPQIGVERLVWYAWEKEGANWQGRSSFRACFKNWLAKDMLTRIDLNKQERTGMGIPIGVNPPNASPEVRNIMYQIATRLRAGQDAGASLPNGADMKLLGTQGTIPDTIASIHLHNEEMARSFLMMFMQLGQTETGSRALGSNFIDFFALALQSIAKWFIDHFQSYVIEDWGNWNYGPDEQLPVLTYQREEEPSFAGRDLAYLVQAGAVTVDEELEDAIRTRYQLPPRPAGDPPPAGPPAPTAPAPAPSPPPTTTAAERQRRSVRAAGMPPLPLPDRPLRRQPYEHEIRAAVDYAALDSSFMSARNTLVIEYRQLQRNMIGGLHDDIVAANGDLAALAALSVEPESADIIASRMVTMANHGATLAREEAIRQGTHITTPNLDNVHASLVSRAEATDSVLSRALGQAASRRAIQLTGGGLTPADVAKSVADYLGGFSTKYLEDNLGGALNAALNDGRKVVMREGDPTRIYASELLDSNTCGPCTDIDGTEYQTVDDADADYPTGGFMDCEGGDRCRGTIVAVYGESAPTLEEPA